MSFIVFLICSFFRDNFCTHVHESNFTPSRTLKTFIEVAADIRFHLIFVELDLLSQEPDCYDFLVFFVIFHCSGNMTRVFVMRLVTWKRVLRPFHLHKMFDCIFIAITETLFLPINVSFHWVLHWSYPYKNYRRLIWIGKVECVESLVNTVFSAHFKNS